MLSHTAGKHVAQLPAHQILPQVRAGGLNPATSSSLPSSRELHPPDTDPGRCPVESHLPAAPGNQLLAAEKSFSEERGTKEVGAEAARTLPAASATPRRRALGEKGQGAWMSGFKVGGRGGTSLKRMWEDTGKKHRELLI